jgi:uncharacterized protein YaaQ
MKMIMAVIPRDQAEHVLDELIASGQRATFTESRGGFLRQAQQTLFIAVDEENLEEVLFTIRQSCHTEVQMGANESQETRSLEPAPVTVELGGAAIFVWDLERLEIH